MKTSYIVAIVLLVCGVTSHAQELSISDPNTQAQNRSQGESYNDPIMRRAAALEIMRGMAPIKSEEDLVIHMLANSKDETSPLHRLSEQSREEFVSSFVFTSNGLASYSSKPLTEELTRDEIYDILQLFGLQYSSPLLQPENLSSFDKFVQRISCDGDINCLNPGDRNDWACEGPGTCVRSDGDICTVNC